MSDKKQSQKQRVLDYLRKHEGIDPITSWQELGIYRLSAVILDLRKEGYNIETAKLGVQNRYGEDCTVGYYVLHEE